MALDLFGLETRQKDPDGRGWSRSVTPLPVGLLPVRSIDYVIEADIEDGQADEERPRLPPSFRQMHRKKRKSGGGFFAIRLQPEWSWGAPLVSLAEHLMMPRVGASGPRNPDMSRAAVDHLIERTLRRLGIDRKEAKKFGRVARRKDDEFLPEGRSGRWRSRFLPLSLVPAFAWAALHPKRARAYSVTTDARLDEFCSAFSVDFLANLLKRNCWGYGEGRQLNVRAFWLREFHGVQRRALKERLETEIREGIAALGRLKSRPE